MGTSIGVLFTQTSCLIWQLTSASPLDCFNVGLHGRRLCRAPSNVHASPPNPRHSLSNRALLPQDTYPLSKYWLNTDVVLVHRPQSIISGWIMGYQPWVFGRGSDCINCCFPAILFSHYWNVRKLSGVLKHVQKCYPFLHLRLIPVNSSCWGLLRNHLERFHAPFSVTSVNKIDLFLCFVWLL